MLWVGVVGVGGVWCREGSKCRGFIDIVSSGGYSE
jgi:hypothetical protein